MHIVPPYLKKGDCIAIVCPSGYMPEQKAAQCILTLEEWGFRVKKGFTLGNSYFYFSGTDAERLSDLQQALDDENVQAILCGRGGYGLSRIIDQLDFTRFRQNPKWIIGFSDITVLHAHLHEVLFTASLHAPMAGAFREGGNDPYVQSLKKALLGEQQVYQANGHPLNRTGMAEGALVGGNLSLVAHLVGTKSGFDTKGKLLFLEDVGEYLYNIDRMMLQLKRAGMLDGLSGMIFGGFTDNKDTSIPFGETVESILQSKVGEFDFPVCFGFPVSHETENYALKIGMPYRLTVNMEAAELREL